MRFFLRYFALFCCLSVASCCVAQRAPRTSARPANVQTGSLAAIDAAAGTVTLKPMAGGDQTYRLTEKTQILRGKKTVALDAFKVGDAVVVRFRRSRVGSASLYDLTDKPSWDWLVKLRREIVPVVVAEISEGSLRATEGTDASEVSYRVTEKTLWGKAGKDAGPADYKGGDQVFVAPRLLPGGGIMATAVADSREHAARLQERTRPTVTGAISALDLTKHTLALHSRAGDDRSLPLAPDCLVRQSSRDVPLTTLRVGQTITAHLTRDSEGERVVTRITIQSNKRPARPLAKRPRTTSRR